MSSTLRVNELQNLNGTTGMTIDTSGHVSRSVIPRWKARNGPVLTAGYFGNTTIGSRVVHDPFNNYDTSTRKYTVPVTGVYLIFYQALIYASTTGSLFIRINGANNTSNSGYTYTEGANVGNTTVGRTTYQDLTAGDEIDIYATGANAWYSNGDDMYNWWGGYLIG